MTQINWNLECHDKRVLPGSINAPKGAILCFSMVAPVQAIEGCTKLRGVGGYTEILLENPAEFSIGFEDQRFIIFNQSWLPRNAYLGNSGTTPTEVAVRFELPNEPRLPAFEPKASKGLRLVPHPTQWQPDGQILNCLDGFAFQGTIFQQDAVSAVNRLAKRNNLPELLAGDTPLSAQIEPDLADEAYILEITADSVILRASGRAGIFNAAISLLTLRFNHNGEIPCGVITDTPRFSWRGQQLDCARHYFQPDTILELLDLMALLKLNKFHWHFNDDEAFRLEVDCYPEIWQKTKLRGEGELMPAVFGGVGTGSGGTYSKTFVKALIERGHDLGIDILPEIEIPAHAYALTRIFPQLRDPEDNTEEASIQGYKANTMNPAMPFMWEFVQNLTRELADIFPFAHIHLGCDERPPEAWKNSPKIRALMAEHGLKTMDDVQGWAIEKTAGIVRANGCRPCAWEEAVKGQNGGIGNDAILFSWTGQGPGLEAARAGYKVVMCPAQNMYFDLAYTSAFNDTGASWAGVLPLENTVEWQPVPKTEPELEENILGVEATYWSEFALCDQDMKPMLVPRILGLSETAWRSIDDPATHESIYSSASQYEQIFTRMGWR